MLTREENQTLTQTGPGTPAGELLRRYWQPVALSEELPPGGPPLAVRILGEDLALFRDEFDRPGLLGIHCAHRAADLSYGRIENGGLRCLYHGWLYDIHGTCLEQPGEPEGSRFKEKVKHLSYPCLERAGFILAYMGPGEPPLLPAYDFLIASPEHVHASKVYSECNYLQGNEGNLDPVHLSYLHKFMTDQGDNRTVAGGSNTSNTYFSKDICPTIETEETDFGLRIFSIRDAEEGSKYVRITNFIYPNLASNPQGVDGYNINWHVPIDDFSSWKFRISYSRKPLPMERLRQQFFDAVGPDWVPYRNRSNRYLQSRDEMQAQSFIGMGRFFAVHDNYATEGQGAIQDRSTEHLGYTDKALAAHRRLLLRAIQQLREEGEAPHTVRDPGANDFSHLVCTDEIVAAGDDWRRSWQKHAASPIRQRSGAS